MTENDYWQSLHPHLRPRVYAWKIAASYIKGVPDWWGSGSSQDLWVENKRIVGNKEPPAILDLTDDKRYLTIHQQLWLERRHEEGRHVGMVVFSRIGHIYIPDLGWKKPISKLEFHDRAMPYKELAAVLINILGELPLEDQVG